VIIPAMTTLISELYTALRKAGVDDETARAAAKAVIAVEDKEHLATKADINDLRREMADMKVELIKWNLGAMAVLTTIYGGMLVAALKFLG
jgi:hypothetical protein